jgi:hypothetical protein
MEKIIMEEKAKDKKKSDVMEEVKTNPLRNERVYVRFVPQENSFAGNNKQHPYYGNLADGATVTLVVPLTKKGLYKNVLTNDEKEYLEEALGLDYNALSVYNQGDNNYWDDYKIVLTKEGMYLDLSNPEDYIKYKVLLANPNIVAPSVKERQERPKVTYRFEIVRDTEETALENAKMDATIESYKAFGKIEDDLDTLRVLIELLDARPYAITEKPEFLRSRANKLIQQDPKKFYQYVTDPLLHAKVVLRRSVELGKVTVRGDFYYLASDGSPLCENGENPTLSMAAKFLNLPSHQDIKYILESEVDKHRI